MKTLISMTTLGAVFLVLSANSFAQTKVCPDNFFYYYDSGKLCLKEDKTSVMVGIASKASAEALVKPSTDLGDVWLIDLTVPGAPLARDLEKSSAFTYVRYALVSDEFSGNKVYLTNQIFVAAVPAIGNDPVKLNALLAKHGLVALDKYDASSEYVMAAPTASNLSNEALLVLVQKMNEIEVPAGTVNWVEIDKMNVMQRYP